MKTQEEVYKVFSDRLNYLITNNTSYNQKEFIEYLDIAHSSLTNYLNGKGLPNSYILYKIAFYFNVTTDYLLGIENNQSIVNIIDNKFNSLTNQLIEQLSLLLTNTQQNNINTETITKTTTNLSTNSFIEPTITEQITEQPTITPEIKTATAVIEYDEFGDPIKPKNITIKVIEDDFGDIVKAEVDENDKIIKVLETVKSQPKSNLANIAKNIAKKGSEINNNITETPWGSKELDKQKFSNKQYNKQKQEPIIETINYDLTPLIYTQNNTSSDLIEGYLNNNNIKYQDVFIQQDDKFSMSPDEFVKECINSNSCVLYIEQDILSETHIETLSNYFKDNLNIIYFIVEDNEIIIK